jgi:hypothetical protein
LQNRVKPLAQKRILIFRMPHRSYRSPVQPRLEGGVSRSSRTCGGMRWTRRRWLTSSVDADGEVVWTWRQAAFLNTFKGKSLLKSAEPDSAVFNGCCRGRSLIACFDRPAPP